MSHPRFLLTPVLLAAIALTTVAAPAVAGPPWIAIEYPANPLNPATRDAILTVRTYRHGTAAEFPLTAHAEGLVNGQRTRLPLSVRPTPIPGAWAVTGQLPRGEGWVVVARLAEGGAGATALVALAADGRLAGVRVPHERREGLAVPRGATAADVDALLRMARAAPVMEPVAGSGSTTRKLAGAGLLFLIPALALRRVRPWHRAAR